MSELGLGAALQKSKPNWLIQVETEAPLLEIFDQKFFGVTNLLTPSAIIYGGSLIAALTDAEILGDLDIGVSDFEHEAICSNFANSMKWIQVSSRPSIARISGYKKDRAFSSSIKRITNFETFYNVSAQIIVAESSDNDIDRFDTALKVARAVDFSICSMAMDMNGRVFETIRGAWDDCRNKVLRIIRKPENINFGAIIERSNKYIARGFVLDEESAKLIKMSKEKASEASTEEKCAYLRDSINGFINIAFTQNNASIMISKKVFTRAMLSENEINLFIKTFISSVNSNFHGKKAPPISTEEKITMDILDHGFNQGNVDSDREAFESSVFDCIYVTIDSLEKYLNKQ